MRRWSCGTFAFCYASPSVWPSPCLHRAKCATHGGVNSGGRNRSGGNLTDSTYMNNNENENENKEDNINMNINTLGGGEVERETALQSARTASRSSRSSVADILHIIAGRRHLTAGGNKIKKNTPPPASLGTSSQVRTAAGVFLQNFTAAASRGCGRKQQHDGRKGEENNEEAFQVNTPEKREEKRREEKTEKVTAAGGTKTPQRSVNAGAAKVSATLLEKLRRNVHRKRIDWDRVPLQRRLPVWRQRSEWSLQFMQSSALPLQTSNNYNINDNSGDVDNNYYMRTEVFVCSAPTGSGKSSLVPLFLLDCHWMRLLQRLDASQGTAECYDEYCNNNNNINNHGPAPPKPFFISGSSREFVTEFGRSSRLCIVVSQPTRLACIQLAQFTSSLLASTTIDNNNNNNNNTADVGGRVGYAVGGDACFSAATEIIYATPGYIVNAIQHNSNNDVLSPTTLIIDEVHCRGMETDLLLAWAKHQLQLQKENNNSEVQLRQLVLMSATLPVEQMVAFFSSQLLSATGGNNEKEKPKSTSEETAKRPEEEEEFTPCILRLDAAERRHNEEASESAHSGISFNNINSNNSPYRVEEYFIDDLPSAIETSELLCGTVKKNNPSTSSLTAAAPSFVCPLLEAPGRRVMSLLGFFFSYTRFAADINSPQARALAQFLLFLLQTIAVAPRMQAGREQTSLQSAVEETEEEDNNKGREGIYNKYNYDSSDTTQPASILVFLPGFSEMSSVLQSLETLCQSGGCGAPQKHNNNNIHSGAAGGVALLQYEQWGFSVALLHATAVGSPQRQLHDSAASLRPHRVILATAVAENSVTIPNVRCVVDACMERRLLADPLTGLTLRRTAVASAGSLRQRSGRAGRTCDGVVFHLAPRRMFPHHSGSPQTSRGFMPVVAASPFSRGTFAGFTAPPQTLPESLTTSAAAVLLRVKYLFPSCPAALLRNLPSPPTTDAIARGMEQLVELELLRLPAGENNNNNNKGDESLHAVLHRYDVSTLTPKGEFVAYLPIPHEQALLIYHALQFACVEEALLIACAMTVPSLFMLPRMTAVSDNSELDAPSAQYLSSLEMQRELAGVVKGKTTSTSSHVFNSSNESSGNEKSDCHHHHHLSEPLMLLALLREWYACHNNNDVIAFYNKYRVNRSAVRLVDGCVAQCAGRLYNLIAGESVHKGRSDVDNNNNIINNNDENNINIDDEELHGEHDTAARRPSTHAVGELITAVFPRQYRKLLAASLQRLRRCAAEHATHRYSRRTYTMTHWYPHDDQLIRMLQPAVNKHDRRLRRQGRTSNNNINNNNEGHKMLFGAVHLRLSAAFVAAFARNTMRGEDGSHRVHHRRLVRNLGVLREDADNTCSFSIELHTQQQQQQTLASLTKGELHSRLTREELHRVLTPYLAGTRLSQLELFLSGRSAVACFAEKELNGNVHNNNNSTLHSTPLEEDKGGKKKQMLLAPCVLAYEQEAKKTSSHSNAAVTLAHIGISLLVAMQSALTRLSVLLPPSTAENINNNGNNQLSIDVSGGHDNNKKSKENEEERSNDSGRVKLTTTPSGHASKITPTNGGNNKYNRGIFFDAVQAAGDSQPDDVCVSWYDSYGHKRSLRLSEVRRAGYDDLFPTPSAAAAARECNEEEAETTTTRRGGDDSSPMTAGLMYTSEPSDAAGERREAEEESATLSVQRVAYTRAVFWKVALPTVRVAYRQSPSGKERTTSSSSLLSTGGGKYYYCWVCHSAWMHRDSFSSHCRSVTHLGRLAFAVRHDMRRGWVEAFSRGTLSDLLLRQCNDDNHHNDNDVVVGMELRHCNLSPTSFMNALQWQPRGNDGAVTMPIAIAGSLVASTLSLSACMSSNGIGANLQALHVWVLDTDREEASIYTQANNNSLPPSLFVLAGYLSSASSGFNVALLMNRNHSRVHAVMLYDWGVWRLPTPLTHSQLQSVLNVFAGKPWRGVPVTTCGNNNNNNNNTSNSSMMEGEKGGLHWCVASDVCPQCTYCMSDDDHHSEAKEKDLQQQESLYASCEGVVASTILLVLHEYQNSQLTVINFAEYVQRLVVKLNVWSAAQQEQKEKEEEERRGIRKRREEEKRGKEGCHRNCPEPQAASMRAIITNTTTNINTKSKASLECHGGAELLARFVARRRNQSLESLLRDIGCQFLTPPASLLHTSPATNNNSREETSAAGVYACDNISVTRSAAASPTAEGTTTEKLFLLPTVLPSYLPAPNFASLLRRHRRNTRRGTGGAAEMKTATGDSVIAPSTVQKKKQQPLF